MEDKLNANLVFETGRWHPAITQQFQRHAGVPEEAFEICFDSNSIDGSRDVCSCVRLRFVTTLKEERGVGSHDFGLKFKPTGAVSAGAL